MAQESSRTRESSRSPALGAQPVRAGRPCVMTLTIGPGQDSLGERSAEPSVQAACQGSWELLGRCEYERVIPPPLGGLKRIDNYPGYGRNRGSLVRFAALDLGCQHRP
jgi:hypothetical protein